LRLKLEVGDQRVLAPHLATLQARLAQPGVEQAYERGCKMSSEHALQHALKFGLGHDGTQTKSHE